MRVAIGFIVGLGLLVGGVVISRKNYLVLAHTLCATGVVILYAITFAARAYSFPHLARRVVGCAAGIRHHGLDHHHGISARGALECAGRRHPRHARRIPHAHPALDRRGQPRRPLRLHRLSRRRAHRRGADTPLVFPHGARGVVHGAHANCLGVGLFRQRKNISKATKF